MTSLCANHSTRKQHRGGTGGQYSTLTGRGRRTVCTICQSGQRVWTTAATAAAAAAAYYVRRHVALPLGPDTVIDRVSVAVPSTHALLSSVHCTPSPPSRPPLDLLAALASSVCWLVELGQVLLTPHTQNAWKEYLKSMKLISSVKGGWRGTAKDRLKCNAIHTYACSIFRLMAKPRWVHKYVRLRGQKWQELTARRSLKCGLNMVWEEWKIYG